MNPSAALQSVGHSFRQDTTVRWSCRQGEFVLWVGTNSFLTADHRSSWCIRDLWEMRDGDYLTITNRLADLPVWFELHPLEVAGSAATEMMTRLEAGNKTKEAMDGPNLWRAKTGDRLFWVSLADSANPVKAFLDLKACALVLGENSNPTSDGIVAFGASEGEDLPPVAAAAMRAAFDAAVALGVPREFAVEWRFGA